MKVGFDISQIAHSGGVALYTHHLAQELSAISEIEMVYFYSSLRKPYRKGKNGSSQFETNLKNVKSFRLPPTLFEVLFNKLHNVPIEKFIGPIDIFHSSDWIQPPTKAKKITTYHDVIPLKYPSWSHPKIVEVHKRRLALVEKEVDMVIAVSEATKKDLLEISKIPEEKITVIYEGVDPIFKPQSKEAIETFRKKYNLPEKFVLIIGGIGERKNIKNLKQAAKEYEVVISGQTIPYLPYHEMPLLYASAQVLLYVTLYEGFGLPILEAMACGTPVVTSDFGATEEIAVGALYATPQNIDEIKLRLDQAFEDENLRKVLIQKGLKRASEFSWGKCAKETATVYQKLLQ